MIPTNTDKENVFTASTSEVFRCLILKVLIFSFKGSINFNQNSPCYYTILYYSILYYTLHRAVHVNALC